MQQSTTAARRSRRDSPYAYAGPGEVVLRVLRCSVCGTDKRIFAHGHKNVVPPPSRGTKSWARCMRLAPV